MVNTSNLTYIHSERACACVENTIKIFWVYVFYETLVILLLESF